MRSQVPFHFCFIILTLCVLFYYLSCYQLFGEYKIHILYKAYYFRGEHGIKYAIFELHGVMNINIAITKEMLLVVTANKRRYCDGSIAD